MGTDPFYEKWNEADIHEKFDNIFTNGVKVKTVSRMRDNQPASVYSVYCSSYDML